MRTTTTALLFLLLVSKLASAQDPWRAVFVTEEGARLDYMTSTNTFDESRDKASAYRFEFSVPAEGDTAMIRLLPVGQNTSPSEDYDALVIVRSADMIALIMVTAGLTRGDTMEVYTLYPKLGVGFLTETNSFLGDEFMKAAAPTNPRIPAASAKAFPLRRIDGVSQ